MGVHFNALPLFTQGRGLLRRSLTLKDITLITVHDMTAKLYASILFSMLLFSSFGIITSF